MSSSWVQGPTHRPRAAGYVNNSSHKFLPMEWSLSPTIQLFVTSRIEVPPLHLLEHLDILFVVGVHRYDNGSSPLEACIGSFWYYES